MPQHQERALPRRCDAVIVGGGAAGLSLARHLAASGWRGREVLIVDDGSRPLDERAWAYWSSGRDQPDPVVSASFDRFWVKSVEREQLVELAAHHYRVVRGCDLSRAVDDALTGAPHFRRVAGHASHVRDGPLRASVDIDGHTVHADWIFDSTSRPDEVGLDRARPATPTAVARAADPAMSLVFTGRRIETDVDTFDETGPTLMDFRTPQGRDLAFVYVLPTSKRVALVEHTRFTTDRAPSHELDDGALDAYVRDVAGIAGHRVLGTERGTISLDTACARPPGRHVVPIGTAAGMVKPSTGYGYARIQRHSADLTRSLVSHGHPFDVSRPPARYRAFDKVLLAAMRREPAAVRHAFERLFVANPGDRVLAFLDERTTVGQELATILTLPPVPFLRVLPGLLRPQRVR